MTSNEPIAVPLGIYLLDIKSCRLHDKLSLTDRCSLTNLNSFITKTTNHVTILPWHFSQGGAITHRPPMLHIHFN